MVWVDTAISAHVGKTQFYNVLVFFIGAGEFQTSVVCLLPGSFVESWSSVHMVVMVLDKSSSFCNISIIICAELSSFNSSLSWNSWSQHLSQTISSLLPVPFNKREDEGALEPVHNLVCFRHAWFYPPCTTHFLVDLKGHSHAFCHSTCLVLHWAY